MLDTFFKPAVVLTAQLIISSPNSRPLNIFGVRGYNHFLLYGLVSMNLLSRPPVSKDNLEAMQSTKPDANNLQFFQLTSASTSSIHANYELSVIVSFFIASDVVVMRKNIRIIHEQVVESIRTVKRREGSN